MPSAPEGFPDPIVTASLYCSGGLDEVLLRAMVPFRQGLAAMADRSSPYVWVVRYARGGEHLKVRVHGTPDLAPVVRNLLDRTAADFLQEIGPPPEGLERVIRPTSPPIDEEDRDPEPPPDRSFRWTRYRRSHVSLGGEPWLADDRYCALMTVCLAEATGLVLDALESRGEVLSHGQRQRLLLKALVTGTAALRLPLATAETYLAYHRDWLIRFPLLQRKGTEQEAAEILARLERQAANAGTTVETLRKTLGLRWTGSGGDAADDPATSGWRRGLADLYGYLSELRNGQDCPPDPFADDPSFPPLFKVFHSLATQLGLRGIDEAYAHHLLLQAATREPVRWQRIALHPDGAR